MNYSYLNDCLPFHQFYSNLKIIFNKRIVFGKNLKTTLSVLYPVGVTKDFEDL